ncbi:MAG: hydroxymethylglutaryl-CoA reductase, degradative [Deltaproteobacteria bacterium]|nr:hydroxymethylglutaryl-CoA reductase, degradative [Deltaproteobacteria bacterium]
MHTRTTGSRIEGFYKLQRNQRLTTLAQNAGLEDHDVTELLNPTPLAFEVADHMIENAIGVLGLPLGVGLNFLINGRERLVPMAVEEPSVVAAASSAARLIREAGGFFAEADAPLMIGQIQLVGVTALDAASEDLHAAAPRLLAAANAVHPNMLRRGAGARKIEVRPLPDTACGPMLIVHLIVDVGDAMGANAVNSMTEIVSPMIEEITGGEARLRILSNLADQRLARATARIPFHLLKTERFDGPEVAQRMMEAWAFAAADPYRATTHNKGVMNGIDAVALATGQDWRGIEAGAHAYAARHGRYAPLSEWRVDKGVLLGSIELPLAVGTVGGNLECNPRVNFGLRMLGVRAARDLAAVMAAVGLAQNFAAMRALVTDGIQRGHMALHARGLAVAAGAPDSMAEQVVEGLLACGEIKLSKAREIVASIRAAA